MLELALSNGPPVFIDPESVWYVQSGGDGITAVYATSGAALFVRGDVREIADRLSAWKRTKSPA
jgi:hypothetical protein